MEETCGDAPRAGKGKGKSQPKAAPGRTSLNGYLLTQEWPKLNDLWQDSTRFIAGPPAAPPPFRLWASPAKAKAATTLDSSWQPRVPSIPSMLNTSLRRRCRLHSGHRRRLFSHSERLCPG